jgi:MFS family permease
LSGIGSGAVASVLGAAVVNRWFATRQGLVMGLLSASTATGALIFLPVLAWLSEGGAWRPVALAVSLGCAALIPAVAWWLTDRYDPRRLLVVYYALRGLSLLALPFVAFDTVSLTVFAVFYGLDWIATLPPTMKLANQSFGERDGPVIFGWVLVAHQIGGAVAAFGAGVIREETGTYLPAFVLAGLFALVAAAAFLLGARAGRDGDLAVT